MNEIIRGVKELNPVHVVLYNNGEKSLYSFISGYVNFKKVFCMSIIRGNVQKNLQILVRKSL